MTFRDLFQLKLLYDSLCAKVRVNQEFGTQGHLNFASGDKCVVVGRQTYG